MIALFSVNVEGRETLDDHAGPAQSIRDALLSSDQMKMFGCLSQLVAELGMRELDQSERAFGRGQALEIHGPELGNDVMSVDAWRGNWPIQPRHDARKFALRCGRARGDDRSAAL